MDKTSCAAFFEENFSFWPHLTKDEQSFLCENHSLNHYKKGATLHSPDDECLGVLSIKSGQLRVYMLSEDGREITLYRLYEGDTCIMSASCVLSEITFDVFVDAEVDSQVLVINAPVFHRLIEQNIYVQAFAYKMAAVRFSDVMWAMQQILFMSFDTRLSIFLLDELAKNGPDIGLTHEQIAKYMGSAREVVSRMLKYFQSEGYVSLYRGGVKILNKQALLALTRK